MSLTTNAYLLTSLDTLDKQNAELLQERTLKMKSRQSLENYTKQTKPYPHRTNNEYLQLEHCSRD